MGPRAPLPTAAVRVPTPASRPPQGPEHSPESPGLLCASPSPSFPASFWGLLSCTFPPNAGFLFDWFFFPPPAARTLPCPTQPGLFIARCLRRGLEIRLEDAGDQRGPSRRGLLQGKGQRQARVEWRTDPGVLPPAPAWLLAGLKVQMRTTTTWASTFLTLVLFCSGHFVESGFAIVNQNFKRSLFKASNFK